MSPPLVIFAACFGAATAAFLPRIARRYADGPEATCAGCGGSPSTEWVRAGPACPCGGGWVPAVLAGAAVSALLAATVGPSPLLPVYLLAAVLGLLLAMIDLRCLRLPDRLVAALALVAAGPLALARPERAVMALLAAAVVLTAYVLVALLPRRGLGLGDVKLAAVLALILGFAGWPAVVVGVLAPHLINGPIALVLLATGRADRRRPLAFGPALLAGALLAITAT